MPLFKKILFHQIFFHSIPFLTFYTVTPSHPTKVNPSTLKSLFTVTQSYFIQTTLYFDTSLFRSSKIMPIDSVTWPACLPMIWSIWSPVTWSTCSAVTRPTFVPVIPLICSKVTWQRCSSVTRRGCLPVTWQTCSLVV